MTTSTTRRAILRGAASALAAMASRPAIAQQIQMQTHLPKGVAPKPRGPVVFLDYDKEELDYAYRQDVWAPNAADIARRNAQKNAALATWDDFQRPFDTVIKFVERFPMELLTTGQHRTARRDGKTAEFARKIEQERTGHYWPALDKRCPRFRTTPQSLPCPRHSRALTAGSGCRAVLRLR